MAAILPQLQFVNVTSHDEDGKLMVGVGVGVGGGGGVQKHLEAHKSVLCELLDIHFFQSMGKIFCVEFQRVFLKFYTKYIVPIHWKI